MRPKPVRVPIVQIRQQKWTRQAESGCAKLESDNLMLVPERPNRNLAWVPSHGIPTFAIGHNSIRVLFSGAKPGCAIAVTLFTMVAVLMWFAFLIMVALFL